MKFASVKVQLREGGLAAARACSAHGGPWWLYWWRAVHAGTATLSVPTGSTLPLVSLPQQQGGGGCGRPYARSPSPVSGGTIESPADCRGECEARTGWAETRAPAGGAGGCWTCLQYSPSLPAGQRWSGRGRSMAVRSLPTCQPANPAFRRLLPRPASPSIAAEPTSANRRAHRAPNRRQHHDHGPDLAKGRSVQMRLVDARHSAQRQAPAEGAILLGDVLDVCACVLGGGGVVSGPGAAPAHCADACSSCS